MGVRNTPEQQRAYNREYRSRLRDAGFLIRTVRVHRDDWDAVKALVAALEDRRKREA